jgi:GT2 family glycosyltransferase
LIFVYHNNIKIVAVTNCKGQTLPYHASCSIAKGLWILANDFEDEKLVWCHNDLKEILNKDGLDILFHHDKLLLSYRPDSSNYFGDLLGYVDGSLFINVNKKVCFPTWQMSSAVGIIHSSVLIKIKDSIPFENDFDYFLSSLAKLSMPMGLLCYSEPKLLKSQPIQFKRNDATIATVFKFVKQHYKTRWLLLLLLNRFIYERKFSFFLFFFSFFYSKRNSCKINLDSVNVKSSREVINKKTIDVIIPTIGRKSYLYDVLCDLKEQTHLPERIIIVEQNPLPNTVSELDYLQTEEWPFEIKHIFTHQAGACNARNLALNEVLSEWVFLADDDNRFEPCLLEEVFLRINQYGNRAVSTSYPQKKEFVSNKKIIQSSNFGAGNSFIRSEFIEKVKFNKGYEFGYGEDNDFGKQLRNQGCDVLYLPKPEILHLKAPMGGFRTKPFLQWQNDLIQPKPSPTIMLYQMNHQTKEQILGYKATLFFKYYKHQKIKNPFNYYINFQKQWQKSVFWANELKKKNEV